MSDILFMRRCLELAEKGMGNTAPNPMVGAVLVYDGHIIGEGWHKEYGKPHAEVNCFDSVAEADRHLIPESILYVSLEPCAHYGKTPPCAERIIKEGVKKVIISNKDSFEQVAGKGIDILRRHGVEVHVGCMEKEGYRLNRRFFCFHEQQRPYIILKWAQTHQHFFAPLNRSRFQLSNKYSSQLSHKWRVEESAILVGYNTALYDNPRLTSRHWKGRQPLRIMLDRRLQVPCTHHLYDTTADTWVVNELREGVAGNVRFIQIAFDGQLLQRLLQRLYEAKRLSLIVEGGVALLDSFIKENLWEEARIFTTPNILPEGIAAPQLKHAEPIFNTYLAGDRLDIYTNG